MKGKCVPTYHTYIQLGVWFPSIRHLYFPGWFMEDPTSLWFWAPTSTPGYVGCHCSSDATVSQPCHTPEAAGHLLPAGLVRWKESGFTAMLEFSRECL